MVIVACFPGLFDGKEDVEITYTIAREIGGQELAIKSAQAVTGYAFENLHLSRLVCLIELQNLTSAKVAKNNGLTFEKAMKDEISPYYLYSRNM